MPAAANAFCINSYVNMVLVVIVLVGVMLDIVAAGHDEDPAVDANHIDFANRTVATELGR